MDGAGACFDMTLAYRLAFTYDQVYGNPYAPRPHSACAGPIRDDTWFSSVAHLLGKEPVDACVPGYESTHDSTATAARVNRQKNVSSPDTTCDGTAPAVMRDDNGSFVNAVTRKGTQNAPPTDAHLQPASSPSIVVSSPCSAPVSPTSREEQSRQVDHTPQQQQQKTQQSDLGLSPAALASSPPIRVRTCATDTAEDAMTQRREAALTRELRGYFVDPAEQPLAPMVDRIEHRLSSYEAKLDGLHELCAALAHTSYGRTCADDDAHTRAPTRAAAASSSPAAESRTDDTPGVASASGAVELAGCLYALKARVTLLKSRAYTAMCAAEEDRASSVPTAQTARADAVPSEGGVRRDVTIVRTYEEEPQPYVKPPFCPVRLPAPKIPSRRSSSTRPSTTSSSFHTSASSFSSSTLSTSRDYDDTTSSSKSDARPARFAHGSNRANRNGERPARGGVVRGRHRSYNRDSNSSSTTTTQSSSFSSSTIGSLSTSSSSR